MPASLPPPVQPVTVNVLPPLPVSVRLAVLIPLKVSDIGPAVSEVGERVKPDAFDAATVAVVPVSNPLPVQPLSVKVCPAPVTARLATVIRVKPSDMPSVDDSDVLVNVSLAALLAATVSALAVLSVSDPARPAADGEGVTAGRVGEVGRGKPAQGQRRPTRHGQGRVAQSDVGRDVVYQRLGRAFQRSTTRPTADGEGIAAAAVVREVGGRDAVRQAQRHEVGG